MQPPGSFADTSLRVDARTPPNTTGAVDSWIAEPRQHRVPPVLHRRRRPDAGVEL